MHTMVVILGVIVYTILALGLICIIVGVVWTISPLEDKAYIGSMLIYLSNPLGGRTTGLVILGVGVISLILGFLLDEEHNKLIRKFGART